MADRPPAYTLLRALRRVRGVTHQEWALGRPQSDDRASRRACGASGPPSAQAQEALIQQCEQAGLFRRYEHGRLSCLQATTRLLRDVLREARTRPDSGVLTPVGTGGVGNTRQALQLASNLAKGIPRWGVVG